MVGSSMIYKISSNICYLGARYLLSMGHGKLEFWRLVAATFMIGGCANIR